MRWLDGHGFGWILGVGDGQGGLVCCGSWGCKESDMTERLNTYFLKLNADIIYCWSFLVLLFNFLK